MAQERASPISTISANGHVDFTDVGVEDTFFPSLEVAEKVSKAVREFAGGAETITLEELRTEVAQSITAC